MANHNDGSNNPADRPSPVFKSNDCYANHHGQSSTSRPVVHGLPHHFSIRKIGDGLSIFDQQGRVAYVNDRLCEMIGCVSDDLIGQPAGVFLSVRDGDPSTHNIEPCSQCGCFHQEAVLRCKDGSSVDVALDRQHIVDSRGQALGTLDIIMDVTEKALMEQAFQDNAEWHRLIVDNLNDVFWVAEIEGVQRPGKPSQPVRPQSVDAGDLIKRWRYIYVSKSFERVFGYPLEQAYQMSLYDVVPKVAHGIVNETVLTYACEAMSTQQRVSTPQSLLFPLTTARGEPCWSETTARMLYDDRRELLRIVGVTRDVTESYMAEEAVRASQEKLSALCNAAQDAVIMMDSEGIATYWNPAAEKMFGYSADEMLGRNVHALLLPSRLHEKVKRGVEQFRLSGQGAVVDSVVQSEAIRKDGTEFPVEIAVSPLMLDGQRSAVGIVRDITDRTQAEQAVRKEQRRLAQLLDVYEAHRKMATYEIHDGVTQPLVSALMTLDAFSQHRGSCPDARWGDFDNAIGILREVVEETRRFMSGMRPPVLDELGVVTALDHLVREHRVADSATIEYHCDVRFERLAPPLETTIFRVVQEGLANAQQHSRSDKIRVELVEQGDQLRILVRDWGIGFEPAEVPHDHFGLEGIRERIAAMGGHSQIDSTPGGGTQISAVLPLLKEQSEPAEE